MINLNVLPTITIGCPIANRSYLIDRFLDAIYNLNYPKDKIKLFFLVNNCNDGTDSTIKKYRIRHEKEYLAINIDTYKMKFKPDKRLAGYRNDIYTRLAELRNYMKFKIDTDYYLSLDSDIIIQSHTLIELLNAQKDIIASVINNDSILRPYESYPNIRTNLLKDGQQGITHYMDFPQDSIVEVGYTGAIYLLSKAVCENKNIKYEFHVQGEDIPFSINARNEGYKLYAHTGLWQYHIMCHYQQFCIDNCCQKPCVAYGGNMVYRYKYLDNVVEPTLINCPKVVKGSKSLLRNM